MKKSRRSFDGLMIRVGHLIPGAFLALWTELVLHLNCIQVTVRDDRTRFSDANSRPAVSK